jgi:hypothetical protein
MNEWTAIRYPTFSPSHRFKSVITYRNVQFQDCDCKFQVSWSPINKYKLNFYIISQKGSLHSWLVLAGSVPGWVERPILQSGDSNVETLSDFNLICSVLCLVLGTLLASYVILCYFVIPMPCPLTMTTHCLSQYYTVYNLFLLLQYVNLVNMLFVILF